jgi:hypothetical protein
LSKASKRGSKLSTFVSTSITASRQTPVSPDWWQKSRFLACGIEQTRYGFAAIDANERLQQPFSGHIGITKVILERLFEIWVILTQSTFFVRMNFLRDCPAFSH